MKADLPILGLLAHDPELKAYVAEFVPDPELSSERKESVFLADHGSTARRASELLGELTQALASTSPVVRVAHAGGDHFDLYTQAGEQLTLDQSPSPEAAFEARSMLRALALEVQLAFIAERRVLSRAAG